MIQIISEQNAEKLSKKAADIIAKHIRKLAAKQKHIILGIPGGRNVSRIFSLLKDEEKIPWEKIHIFMADERLVPLNSEESNFKLANDTFLKELVTKKLLPRKNIHPFIADESKHDFGIYDYEKELKKYSDSYDILLLSSGEDCHIASLFPNHNSVKDDSEYYVLVTNAPKPPERRISISRKHVLRVKVALLLFIGESKKDAYYAFLSEKNNICSCPAKLVKSVKEAYIFTNIK
jgi:6-phosphogluconolactonase